MTCIVGMEVEGKVVIVGDVQGTGHNSKIHHTQSKVFERSGMIFGYTTSYRFGQIIEHSINKICVPFNEKDIYPWLVSEFVTHCSQVLKSSGYDTGGTCLIGISGQLWRMEGDFSVLRSVEGFDAVGSGCEFALGCMTTTLNMINKNTLTIEKTSELLKDTIASVSKFCPSVGSDTTVMVK